jgi:hypothetical protein
MSLQDTKIDVQIMIGKLSSILRKLSLSKLTRLRYLLSRL